MNKCARYIFVRGWRDAIKVSWEDFEWASEFRWSYSGQGSVTRPCRDCRGVPIPSPLHREVAWAHPGQYVDHINMDRTDNRRENLRVCTNAENNRNRLKHADNTSGYKGVNFDAHKGLYRATIGVNYKQVWLGYHQTAEDAARAYDRAAVENHGEFACLNFP